MILVALGSNLSHPQHGGPEAVLQAAIVSLEANGVRVVERSNFYRTAPVPASGTDTVMPSPTVTERCAD